MPLQSFSVLARLLAEKDASADLPQRLHEHAVAAAGGVRSLLFQVNPRTAQLHATSGFGLDALPADPWPLGSDDAQFADEVLAEREARVLDDLATRMPALASSLSSERALLVPLATAQQEPDGLLAVGLEPGADEVAALKHADWLGSAFVLVLERARLRREAEFQRELRSLLDAFSRVASSALSLVTALEIFCRDANALFGAQRTSVWFHDRRARDLVLAASSDPAHMGRGTRVPADSALSPAAVAMRRARAEFSDLHTDAQGVPTTVTVPLKGRRRALGTIVFDGVRIEPGNDLDLLDSADELGRQLSSAIENVQLLEEVLRSRRELEKTVNAIPDLVAVCDVRLRLVDVNQAFAERLGMTRQQAGGRHLLDSLGLEAANWVRSLDLWGGTGGETFTREVEDVVLNGRFSVTVSTLIGTEGEPIGMVLVARDVTQQSRLEQEQEQLRSRLSQSEKLAALGQLVAGFAHELNNPLQSVLGHLELLRRQPDLTKDARRSVQTAYRDADRAAKVVANLLVFAGRRRLSRRTFSLNSLISKILTARARACKACQVELVRDLDPAVPPLQGDTLLLQQAVQNLVINAEQALSGRSGRIEVRSRFWPSRNVVVIEVRDNGPGIPPDALPRVFEPFYTTKEVGQGSGLGLTIAYGIVQEHGGQVMAANHQEGGAVLTIELPAGTAERGA